MDLRARVLSVATAFLLLFSLVGLATVRPPDQALDSRLVAAASATAKAGTARMALSIRVEVAGNEIEGRGTGSVDFANQRATCRIDVPGAGTTMQSVVDGGVLYAHSPLLGGIAPDRPWVAIEAPALGQSSLSMTATGGEMLGALQAMQAEGTIDEVRVDGTDEVRGVRATKYVGDLDVEALTAKVPEEERRRLEQLSMFRFDSASIAVWVGPDDLVARMTTSMRGKVSGRSYEMSFTTELFDYGTPVTIDVPPEDQVRRMPAFPNG